MYTKDDREANISIGDDSGKTMVNLQTGKK
jgi:hypothetical protein